ncbi:MAG: hypothetical protein IK003_10425 [Prevotella sp.]|nr:hypothetical protein [Prevotella sp.]
MIQHFLEWIRQYDLRRAGIVSVIIGAFNILIHTLVLSGILPYQWVNGGRTESFEAACQTAVSSIIITVVSILIAAVASQLIPVRFNRFWGIVLSAILILALPLSFLAVIQQFLGTTFERCVMSIVTIIGFCAAARIAFEKRW